jgi:hypothetical protein
MPPVRLEVVKDEARRSLVQGAPAREAIMALPDEMDEAAYDSTIPLLIRLLRMRTDSRLGSPAAGDTARGMEAASGSGQPRES